MPQVPEGADLQAAVRSMERFNRNMDQRFHVTLEDQLSPERLQDGEEIILNFQEMSRCTVCGRLVTLRRLLREGMCKCLNRKVVTAGFLREEDILEIEEEYGWDHVTITGLTHDQISPRLHPPGCDRRGEADFGLHEERLHSSALRGHHRERNRRLEQLADRRWLAGHAGEFLRKLVGKS